jgi:hypothetical protein
MAFHFIKLTNMLINTHHIRQIVITPDKYSIMTTNSKIKGGVFVFAGVCYGSIDSDEDNIIDIYKMTKPIDHQIISDWIDRN